jgi:hypothetical protein
MKFDFKIWLTFIMFSFPSRMLNKSSSPIEIEQSGFTPLVE